MGIFAASGGEQAVVGICITTVNRPRYLAEALRSVCDQTYRDLEILVSDNSGSQSYADQVDRIVEETADPRVRVAHRPTQTSITAHLNLAITGSTADLIGILPDDDRMQAPYVATMVAALAADADADLASCSHWIIDAAGQRDDDASDAHDRTYGRSGRPTGPITEAEFLPLATEGFFLLQGTIFRRDCLLAHRFDPAMEAAPDYDLFIRLASATPPLRAAYVAERLIDYRRHDTQSAFDGVTYYATLVRCLERAVPRDGHSAAIRRKRLARYYGGLAGALAATGDRVEAAKASLRSLRLEPADPRLYLHAIEAQTPRVGAFVRRSLRGMRP